MRIQFKATTGMPFWIGYAGRWKDKEVKEVPDDIARRLLSLHHSPFVEVGAKQAVPTSDKMVHGAPDTKATIDELKPKGLEKQPKFKPGFRKKKR